MQCTLPVAVRPHRVILLVFLMEELLDQEEQLLVAMEQRPLWSLVRQEQSVSNEHER